MKQQQTNRKAEPMSDLSTDDYFNTVEALPYIKFPAVNDTIKGDVIDARAVFEREFETREVITDPEGKPQRQLVVDFRTTDGDKRLYCKKACARAIRTAVAEAGKPLAASLAELVNILKAGGTLTIKRTEDGQGNKPGITFHQFKARFEPKAADGVDDLDDF